MASNESSASENTSEETVALSNTSVVVADIIDTNRVRSDMGDINGLVASIKEFGIIQPIVLARGVGGEPPVLVAGGRRLASLRRLGYKELHHAVHFIWRDEDNVPEAKLRFQAIELEENLKRKDLTWSEVCLGKQRLLEIMQSIHGEASGGRQRRVDIRSGSTGFGVRTLASLLGENPSTTSRDLEVAKLVGQFPSIAKLPTKQDALRRLNLAVTVSAMQTFAKANAAKSIGVKDEKGNEVKQETRWKLYHGKFQDNLHEVVNDSVDLIACDLPYACGLGDSTASHAAGLSGFSDSFDDVSLRLLLDDVARAAFAKLRQDRFAVFFFGFAYYKEFYDALVSVGFTIDSYPFIWKRDRTAPPSAFTRYAKTYDPALICSKGNPTFIRSGLSNFIDIPSVRGDARLQSAQKPVEVMERFILDMTTEGSTVVDFMAGSGTTGVAAVKNKRKTILFELEEASCKIIEARLGAL